ncbi:DUF1573 domain-containing protein [Kaistella antarctica]|uniref:Protein of uncharacterized function (DUF1573) n=1 Tax=Kaistella antarctica TaxID=266748 RepID=A0A3S4VGA6_9FLAO|nr:DUF1573 domain-containing protein [Kaistella antarctica]KEY18281.1 hypothetical protein HY04_07115 [Kaistella antarctica]SEV84278.1 Protein of unknown function [Kaistella antarctica]VEI00920.1 Protein of uncharacterised function (DUF1573) [Kaistella antarctica]
MKNFIKIAPLAVALTLLSCKKDQTADQLVIQEDNSAQIAAPMPVDSNAEMIKEAQSKPLTNLVLSEAHFEFGKMKKGDQKEHIYEVTNTGENPLIISQVKPGCGCTVPDYTKEPILPGKKGKITLKFDSSSFDGLVNKQAEVYANVEKAPIIISFSADIQP